MDKVEQQIKRIMKKLPPHNFKTCVFCNTSTITVNFNVKKAAIYAQHLEAKHK